MYFIKDLIYVFLTIAVVAVSIRPNITASIIK